MTTDQAEFRDLTDFEETLERPGLKKIGLALSYDGIIKLKTVRNGTGYYRFTVLLETRQRVCAGSEMMKLPIRTVSGSPHGGSSTRRWLPSEVFDAIWNRTLVVLFKGCAGKLRSQLMVT
jgi:hypothetical protein